MVSILKELDGLTAAEMAYVILKEKAYTGYANSGELPLITPEGEKRISYFETEKDGVLEISFTDGIEPYESRTQAGCGEPYKYDKVNCFWSDMDEILNTLSSFGPVDYEEFDSLGVPEILENEHVLRLT